MSGNLQRQQSQIYPVFRYNNAPNALGWLAKAFGFKTFLEVPGPSGSVAHAEMALEQAVIMLGSTGNDPSNPWTAVKQGVYVYVDDVDAHYAQARATGATIVKELQDTPHGSREYSVQDLEGFLWGFGNFRPDPTH